MSCKRVWDSFKACFSRTRKKNCAIGAGTFFVFGFMSLILLVINGSGNLMGEKDYRQAFGIAAGAFFGIGSLVFTVRWYLIYHDLERESQHTVQYNPLSLGEENAVQIRQREPRQRTPVRRQIVPIPLGAGGIVAPGPVG